MRIRPLSGIGLTAILVLVGCNKDQNPESVSESSEKTADPQHNSGAPIPAKKPRTPAVTLPEGTQLPVRTTTTLSTKTIRTGQSFIANLDQPLMLNSRQILPKGAEVEGTIVESDKGGRVKGLATIAVQLTRLHTAGGQIVNIATDTVTREANATKGKDAVKLGIGSGVGAAIGAIAGGGKGAAIGAAAGAGAGTGTVLATRGDPAVIPSETLLNFTLSAPVTIAQ